MRCVGTAFRPLSLWFSGVCMVVGAAHTAACESPQLVALRAGVVTQSSVWDEYSGIGSRLLRESGRLTGPAAQGNWSCDRWSVGVGVEQATGVRDYDGQTNTGVPLKTQSRLQQFSGYAQVAYAVYPALKLGARLSGMSMEREIASTGTVSGYPEHYEWLMLSLGGEWAIPTAFGTVSIGLWTGQTTESAMRVQLPGRDTAWLDLGSIQQSQVDIQWERQMGAQWKVQGSVGYRRTDIAQGKPGVITSQGVPVSSAYQPRASLVEVPVSLSVQYQF